MESNRTIDIAGRIELFGDRAVEVLQRIDERLADLSSVEGSLVVERPALVASAAPALGSATSSSNGRSVLAPRRSGGHLTALALGVAAAAATMLVLRAVARP